MSSIKKHWENIYSAKTSEEFSWTQSSAKISIAFLESFNVPKNSAIIDIGGGESNFVDYLLENGYSDVTVLDISSNAIERTKARLGLKAKDVQWIVSDINDFNPARKYIVWHDRATFHFLTEESHVQKYVTLASSHIDNNGYMTIGTFSEDGPSKCSGLDVRKYSEDSLTSILEREFTKIKCIKEDHLTPFRTLQNFLFCSFKHA